MDIKRTLHKAMGLVGMTTIPKEWFDKIREVSQHTPDMVRVMNNEEVLFFNPDETLDVPAIAPVTCFTQSTFVAYQARAHNRLVLLPNLKRDDSPSWARGSRKAGASVQGEACWINANQVPALDNYYRNGVEFERTSVWVMIPYKLHDQPNAVYGTTAKCMTYVGKKKFWWPRLDAGYSTAQIHGLPSTIRCVPNHIIDPRGKRR
jgi:hypothetical protein